MSATKVRIAWGGDVVDMVWDPAEASAPIRVDGVTTPYQTADARHSTGRAVQLVASVVWPEVVWDEDEDAWDSLTYMTEEE